MVCAACLPLLTTDSKKQINPIHGDSRITLSWKLSSSSLHSTLSKKKSKTRKKLFTPVARASGIPGLKAAEPAQNIGEAEAARARASQVSSFSSLLAPSSSACPLSPTDPPPPPLTCPTACEGQVWGGGVLAADYGVEKGQGRGRGVCKGLKPQQLLTLRSRRVTGPKMENRKTHV